MISFRTLNSSLYGFKHRLSAKPYNYRVSPQLPNTHLTEDFSQVGNDHKPKYLNINFYQISIEGLQCVLLDLFWWNNWRH